MNWVFHDPWSSVLRGPLAVAFSSLELTTHGTQFIPLCSVISSTHTPPHHLHCCFSPLPWLLLIVILCSCHLFTRPWAPWGMHFVCLVYGSALVQVPCLAKKKSKVNEWMNEWVKPEMNEWVREAELSAFAGVSPHGSNAMDLFPGLALSSIVFITFWLNLLHIYVPSSPLECKLWGRRHFCFCLEQPCLFPKARALPGNIAEFNKYLLVNKFQWLFAKDDIFQVHILCHQPLFFDSSGKMAASLQSRQ